MSPLTRLTRTAWRPFEDFDHEFRPRFREPVSWSPPVELAETDDELLLRAELPGIERDSIEIEVESDVLTLRGEKNEERSELGKKRRYHLWERSYGKFQRTFALPRSVDVNKITAEFENGVLRVSLPKTVQSRGRRVEIATK